MLFQDKNNEPRASNINQHFMNHELGTWCNISMTCIKPHNIRCPFHFLPRLTHYYRNQLQAFFIRHFFIRTTSLDFSPKCSTNFVNLWMNFKTVFMFLPSSLSLHPYLPPFSLFSHYNSRGLTIWYQIHVFKIRTVEREQRATILGKHFLPSP